MADRAPYDRLGASRRLLHHHLPYRLTTKRHRPLTSPVRLDLELIVLAHHPEEPVVRITGCVE